MWQYALLALLLCLPVAHALAGDVPAKDALAHSLARGVSVRDQLTQNPPPPTTLAQDAATQDKGARPARIALSRPAAGAPAIEFVCRPDGLVGAFLRPAGNGGDGPGRVVLFAPVDALRSLVFIEKGEDPAIIVLPEGWDYRPDSALGGTFLASARLAPHDEGMAPALAGLTGAVIHLLQIAATNAVVVETNGEAHTVEIDLGALTPGALSRCLRTAGLDAAIAALNRAPAPVDRTDTQQACILLLRFHEGLERTLRAAGIRADARDPVFPLPVPERADCFQLTKSAAPAILSSARAAVTLIRTLDFAGLARAAHALPLPAVALAALKRAQHRTGDAPSPSFASPGDGMADSAETLETLRLNYVYLLFAKVRACADAYEEGHSPLFSTGEMAVFHRRMQALVERFGNRLDTGAAWGAAMAEYPALLASARSALHVNNQSGVNACLRGAGLFEVFSTRLLGATRLAADF